MVCYNLLSQTNNYSLFDIFTRYDVLFPLWNCSAIIILQPYKLRKVNVYHALVLLYLAASCFSVTAFDLATIKAQWSINTMMFIVLLFAVLPTLIVVVYIVCCAVHKCYKEGKQCFSQKCKELRRFMQASTNMQRHENNPLHSATIRSYQAV